MNFVMCFGRSASYLANSCDDRARANAVWKEADAAADQTEPPGLARIRPTTCLCRWHDTDGMGVVLGARDTSG